MTPHRLQHHTLHVAFKQHCERMEEARLSAERLSPIAAMREHTRVWRQMAEEIARERRVATFRAKHGLGPENEWDAVSRTLFLIEHPEVAI